MSDNRRHYFRLEFAHPLGSDMRIVGAYGKELDTKKTRVCVRDLSAGGLRFSTRLNLPVDANLLLEFRFTLLDKEIRTIGTVLRMLEPEPGINEYGVKFTIFDSDEIALTGLINVLAIKLKRTPTLSSCSFCTQEELDMLYARNVPIYG